MRILGLASYPVEAAATRFRLSQFVAPLAERGIELTVSPFLDREQYLAMYRPTSIGRKLGGLAAPLLRRIAATFRIGQFDALFVQREAMFFGPAFFENLYRIVGRIPLILDLDDATYVAYESPTYGKIGSFFKFFGKTDRLIDHAAAVVCGNRFIAEYAERRGAKTVIVPTVADTDIFKPVERNNAVPVLGWIGTHSTFPLLESIFPVLETLSDRFEFKLRVVGAGVENISVGRVDVENLPWKLDRETEDFQTLDIGLYPIAVTQSASSEWLLGKSGFKAIQYMSVGVPFVVTPIGVCAELGVAGETHFEASDAAQWSVNLARLLESRTLRTSMGERGRQFALEHFTVDIQAEKLARLFNSLA